MKEICFATHNLNKLKEIQKLLPEFKIVSLTDINCNEEIPETRDTIEGNSLQKAEFVWENYSIACFADDTGLEVEALENRPGVYSARYAGEHKNSKDNITKVLKELEGIENRNAKFKTVITLAMDGKYFQFEGIIKGEIVKNESGNDGFGYDPIFKPFGYDQTFAQMPLEEKNKISHRALAVNKLVEFLKL